MTRKRSMACARPFGHKRPCDLNLTFFACYSLFAIRDGTPNAVRHTWASLVIP